MKRRTFISLSGAAAIATLINRGGKHVAAVESRQFYEVRQYHLENDAQKGRLAEFLGEVGVPAFKRLGIEPVGVFEAKEGLSIYLVLPFDSMDAITQTTQALLADATFEKDGAALLNTPSNDPAYTSADSSILMAFAGMPTIERPTEAPSRVFQLRIYESPSMKAGQKKIEMFNKGEIDIFRKTGLNPVFFGEAIAGAALPNLTYMLGFENEDAQKAAWDTFRKDPDWLKLSAIPEYSNERLIRKITNIELRPLPGSQI